MNTEQAEQTDSRTVASNLSADTQRLAKVIYGEDSPEYKSTLTDSRTVAGGLNLDVDAPDKVSAVLQRAAQTFYEAHTELQSAWQDEYAGQDWTIIARILERAASQIDNKIGSHARSQKRSTINL